MERFITYLGFSALLLTFCGKHFIISGSKLQEKKTNSRFHSGTSEGIVNRKEAVMNRKLYCCLMAILAIALLTACGEATRIILPKDDVVEVRIESPEDGAVFYFGEFTPCEHRIVRNTGGFEIETTWTVGDNTFSCGVPVQILMVQDVSPPEELVLPPGTYQIELMARAKSNHSVFDEDVVTITIVPEPSYITYTAVTLGRDFYRLSADAEKELERLTNDGDSKKYWPEISPDGTKLAYVRSREPCNGILVIRYLYDFQEEVEIGEGPGTTWEECELKSGRSPRWSPDGWSIAVIGGYEPVPGVYRLSVVDVATHQVTHLDEIRTCVERYEPVPCIDGIQLEVVWSPDGRSIYTTLWESLGNNGNKGRVHVVRIDLASLAVTRLFTSPVNSEPGAYAPAVYDISKDGGTLSLRIRYSHDSGRSPRLATLDVGSGELRFVTPEKSGNPDWPTFCEVGGEEWIFYVDKERRNELRRMKPDGTNDEVFYTASHDIATPRCQDSPNN